MSLLNKKFICDCCGDKLEINECPDGIIRVSSCSTCHSNTYNEAYDDCLKNERGEGI